jgi:hypothetical protein
MTEKERFLTPDINYFFYSLGAQNELLRQAGRHFPFARPKITVAKISKTTVELLKMVGIVAPENKTSTQKTITREIDRRNFSPAMRLAHYLTVRKIVGEHFHHHPIAAEATRQEWQEQFNILGTQIACREVENLLITSQLTAKSLHRGLGIIETLLKSIVSDEELQDKNVLWARERLQGLQLLTRDEGELCSLIDHPVPVYFQAFLQKYAQPLIDTFQPLDGYIY